MPDLQLPFWPKSTATVPWPVLTFHPTELVWLHTTKQSPTEQSTTSEVNGLNISVSLLMCPVLGKPPISDQSDH